MPDHMREAMSRTMVKTGPTSILLMAVYTSSLVAENAKKVVDFFLIKIEHYMLDNIAFHGEAIEF